MKPVLEELRETLQSEGLVSPKDLESAYATALRDPKVRELLEIETPDISDFTEILRVENGGSVYVVRMDLNKDVDNHKKSVVAGLILRGVMKGRIPRNGVDTLIDGGNYNSASALKYYSKKFGMKGMYVMSRLFPPNITGLLEDDGFQIVRAPRKHDHAREREFYEYLFELMTDPNFRKDKHCLWHAKYSGKAMYPLGREIAEKLENVPDCVVSCLGAGSTLEGLQLAIQDYFVGLGSERPRVIVAEHELSPLFAKTIAYRQSSGVPSQVRARVKRAMPESYLKHPELPHIVIGPHYDEINPLLSKDTIARIDEVIQYSEEDWMSMQTFLETYDISVGNSSAANLAVATNLANLGNRVVTVLFEPFRDFYKSSMPDAH